MIGRKLTALRSGIPLQKGELLFAVPPLEEIKALAGEKAKKAGEVGIETFLTAYVKSLNYIKYAYNRLKKWVLSLVNKYYGFELNGENSPKEASKFLKLMADYKRRVYKIKRQIREERKKSEDSLSS